MRTLRDSRQNKLQLLLSHREELLFILASREASLHVAKKMGLYSATYLFEEKVNMTRSEIFKLDKKIARLKRKIKEKN